MTNEPNRPAEDSAGSLPGLLVTVLSLLVLLCSAAFGAAAGWHRVGSFTTEVRGRRDLGAHGPETADVVEASGRGAW